MNPFIIKNSQGFYKDLAEREPEDEIIFVESEEALETIRHDAAHILAQAVKSVFPNVQVTIGPSIENGFYYDFAKDDPFSSDDLELIEEKMRSIVNAKYPITKELWDRDDAVKFFREIGENYKAEIISSIPLGEKITLYRQGDFIDLCRGPHGPNTGLIKYFKLLKVAGAYWRGDSKNKMLQRIYGTAWHNKKALEDYLTQIEEAEKRDHRKLGKELGLFHLQPEAQGGVFWHDKGWTIYRIVEDYIRKKLSENDYLEVKTPILLNQTFWEQSGHWEKFRDNMFVLSSDDEMLAVKPMSCPCHVQIFKQGIKSYRDLPIRMAEFGHCHRNEPSGSLHGLMRVRGFVQDDAHIFCTEDQITEETIKFCRLLKEIYRDFGFDEVSVKFSDRPQNRAGSDEIWNKAEESLKNAIEGELSYVLNPGEGAFYGPKLEFVLKDAIGRQWQCGTLQVDFVLPERLGATYIDKDGSKKTPVMLHRAILGTLERFIGILIEQCAGRFPLWLSPVQVTVATVTNDFAEYALAIHKKLKEHGVRSVLDDSSEKISYKIRSAAVQKTPFTIIIGKREQENATISVRALGSDKTEEYKIEDFIQKF